MEFLKWLQTQRTPLLDSVFSGITHLGEETFFIVDGWAVWIDGDDTSTIYINHWLNPKGNSYVDVAIRIRSVMASKCLHLFVPFAVSRSEIEDVSLLFQDRNCSP